MQTLNRIDIALCCVVLGVGDGVGVSGRWSVVGGRLSVVGLSVGGVGICVGFRVRVGIGAGLGVVVGAGVRVGLCAGVGVGPAGLAERLVCVSLLHSFDVADYSRTLPSSRTHLFHESHLALAHST